MAPRHECPVKALHDALQRLEDVRRGRKDVAAPSDTTLITYFDLAMSKHEFGQLARTRALDRLVPLRPHLVRSLGEKYSLTPTPRQQK